MSTAHSPAPWRIGASADPRGREYGLELGIYDVHSSKIAVLEQWTGAAQAEAEANHRLIAAAPELLDALKWAQARVFVYEGASDVYAHCAKLIAKAEGRA